MSNFQGVGSDVRPLIDYVRLKDNADPRLQVLVDNTFGSVVLVKDYTVALRVAKENYLTCVTPDL